MRLATIALTTLLALPSCLGSMTYYALELRGGSRFFALDRPVRKGRLVLFHRYPDGVFVSLAAQELERIVPTDGPPKPEGQGLAPGQTVFIGTAVEGPGYEAPPAEGPPGPPAPDQGYGDYYGYGYTGWWWGGGGPVRPPGPPHRPPPALVGPNGFPMSPPGTIGSQPLPIGPNGFPILAPQPPHASPRRR
jgi:hypothetical protein